MNYLEEFTEEQKMSMYSELNTNEEELQKSVNYLQEWLRQQPHLPEIKDEDFLKNFLLFNKNRMEITKQRLEVYLMVKTLNPRIFSKRAEFFEEFEKIFKNGQCTFPLPKLTPDGYRVLIYRLNKLPSDHRSQPEIFLKCGSIITDIGFKTDYHKSMICVYDYENVNPVALVELLTFIKNSNIIKKEANSANPNRIQKVYILNLPTPLRWILNLMKDMISPKIFKRIVIWEKRPEDLAEEIPKNILPSIYGGTEKSLNELREEFFSFCQQYREWITECDSWLVDLSKIPEDSNCKKWKDDIVEPGLDGSFRSLNIE